MRERLRDAPHAVHAVVLPGAEAEVHPFELRHAAEGAGEGGRRTLRKVPQLQLEAAQPRVLCCARCDGVKLVTRLALAGGPEAEGGQVRQRRGRHESARGGRVGATGVWDGVGGGAVVQDLQITQGREAAAEGGERQGHAVVGCRRAEDEVREGGGGGQRSNDGIEGGFLVRRGHAAAAGRRVAFVVGAALRELHVGGGAEIEEAEAGEVGERGDDGGEVVHGLSGAGAVAGERVGERDGEV